MGNRQACLACRDERPRFRGDDGSIYHELPEPAGMFACQDKLYTDPELVHNLYEYELIYLATPYSHKDPQVREYRFFAAREHLVQMNGLVYSPIVHCHPIATVHGMPKDAKYWRRHNYAVLERCSEMRILKLPGWDTSLGVKDETKFATSHNIPVTYDFPTPKFYELVESVFGTRGE